VRGDGKVRITDHCCGCGPCFEAYPNHAIEMTTPTMEAIENTVKQIHNKVDISG
jgi:Pyruvate/2-oxoacid:ferredoxin oxidoreductase delta subunit